MVKIRLKRMGMKKHPFYRIVVAQLLLAALEVRCIVVADERSPRDGRFIEEIGYYNPMTQPAQVKVDNEKAQDWMKKGAQPTDTVRVLLKKSGAIEG